MVTTPGWSKMANTAQYEFLRQFSEDPKNTVIGIVRNKPGTEKKISEDADLKSRANIHILEADVSSYEALKAAAATTADITGGSLDYLIANAAIISTFDNFDGFQNLSAFPEKITEVMRELNEVNVIGQIHLFNLFVPLLLKGKGKKAVLLTSGFADLVSG
jgi:NAD(P)-dependent dehydrogenase (short-subunit alcohol dehydrogenase family)